MKIPYNLIKLDYRRGKLCLNYPDFQLSLKYQSFNEVFDQNFPIAVIIMESGLLSTNTGYPDIFMIR